MTVLCGVLLALAVAALVAGDVLSALGLLAVVGILLMAWPQRRGWW